MPNGIYKSSIAQSCATGNANTPSVIFSAQIPGSSVDLANAFALHAELIAYSSGGPLTLREHLRHRALRPAPARNAVAGLLRVRRGVEAVMAFAVATLALALVVAALWIWAGED